MTQLVETDHRKPAPAEPRQIQVYLAEFERLAKTREASEPTWLREFRRQAMARFNVQGFPSTRDEEWKFTSVAPIAESNFVLADERASRLSPAQIEAFVFESEGARLTVVNGQHAPALSVSHRLPTGVDVSPLGQVLSRNPERLRPYFADNGHHNVFAALNGAFCRDGAFVEIPRNTIVDRPIHLVFVSATAGAATMSHPRVIVLAGENSQATIVESYAGFDGQVYLTNALSSIVVGENAVIDHYKVQREGLRGFHVGLMHVRTARSSTFSSHSLAMGGALVRNDVRAALDGEGGDCTLNGLYLATGRQLVDNHTTIDHAKSHCGSHEVYKGIIGDRARAVFNGKIIVRPDAQKTDAKQTNRALLLSDEAQINTKPQLEIFANDVKCTHGATIGQLDDDAIFYLRSRGIGLSEARQVLIHAFAGDILNRIKIEPLRRQLEHTLSARLGEHQIANVQP